MRRLGFVAASQRAAGERLVAAVVEQWRTQWCFAPTAPISWQQADIGPGALQWLAVPSPGGMLWVGANWSQVVFAQHAAQVPDDRLRDELLQAAQQALGASLLEALDCPAGTLNPCSSPAHLGTVLDARLLLCAHLGEAPLQVLLDVALLDSFLPQPPGRQPLHERRAVIGGARLRVSVGVPFASLPVSEVNALRPGDVLQGSAPLNKPLHLTIHDSRAVATGYLARRDNRLALQLTPHEQ